MQVPPAKVELQQSETAYFPFLELYGQKEVPYPIECIVEAEPARNGLKKHADPRVRCQLVLTRQDLEEAAPKSNKRLWTQQDDQKLIEFAQGGEVDWKDVNEVVLGRNENRCFSRYQKLKNDQAQVWKQAEDDRLLELVGEYGPKWGVISAFFSNRNSRQLKHRYDNQLRPGVLRREWTIEQDLRLIDQLNEHGKNWELAQKVFPERTERQVKNRYYGKLRHLNEKKLKKMHGDYLPI